MALGNLLTYKPTEETSSSPNKPKEKLKLRFSLYFDGTKNNRDNILEREKHEVGQVPITPEEKAHAQSYTDFGVGGDNSYDNGRTNIAIMEPCAIPTQKGYEMSFTIYIEGQGTKQYQKDNLPGYAFGAGNTGVANRAEEGVRGIFEKIRGIEGRFPAKSHVMEKIDIDVFGFSRGAAAARHSISLMLESFNADTILPNRPLYKRIEALGYEIQKKAVEIKFAGLYDTVLSVNASQLNPLADNKLNQRAVALATKSVHLCAAEEHRLDFPLHTIRSALNKGTGKQYYLPGAHSDVGGSYNLANGIQAEKLKNASTIKVLIAAGSYTEMTTLQDTLITDGTFTDAQLEFEPTASRPNPRLGLANVITKGKLFELRTLTKENQLMRTSSEIDKIINSADAVSLYYDQERLLEQGWYRPDEIKVKAFGAGYTVVNRKNIKSAYCNIPLKLMAKFAAESGILFDTKLVERANLILSREPDLLSLEKSIDSYIAKMGDGKSQANDWLEDPHLHHKCEKYPIKHIRHDHLHMAAETTALTQTNFGYTPRFTLITGKRERYYYDG